MFSYYGGKRNFIKKYPNPPQDVTIIVEPFAGSCSYIVHHMEEEDDREFIGIESSKLLHKTYRFLQDCDEEEISTMELRMGKTIEDDFPDLNKRAFASLQSQVGCAHLYESKTVTEWGLKQWPSRRNHIVRSLPKTKRVKIIEGNCFDYFDQLDSPTTLWFIDPPYTGIAGSHYRSGLDHEKLAEQVKKLEGYVVVCGNENDKYLPFEYLFDSRCYRGKKLQEWIYKQRM